MIDEYETADLEQFQEQTQEQSQEEHAEVTEQLLLHYLPPESTSVYRLITFADESSYEGFCRQLTRPLLPRRSRFQKVDEYDQSLHHPLENDQIVKHLQNELSQDLEHDVPKHSFILHGKGSYTFANRDRFDGVFSCNRMHGRGVHTYNNGTAIEGLWCLGVLDSTSSPVEIMFANGDTYVGWIHGKSGVFHGEGTFVHRNGARHVGEWRDGVPHGKGVLTKTTAYELTGEFLNGVGHGEFMIERHPGHRVRMRQSDRGEEEEKEKGKAEKRGGYVYRGAFLNGVRHGWGKMEWSDDETMFEGEFENGRPCLLPEEEEEEEEEVEEEEEEEKAVSMHRLSQRETGVILHRSKATGLTSLHANKMFCYLLDKNHWNHRNFALLESNRYKTRQTTR